MKRILICATVDTPQNDLPVDDLRLRLHAYGDAKLVYSFESDVPRRTTTHFTLPARSWCSRSVTAAPVSRPSPHPPTIRATC